MLQLPQTKMHWSQEKIYDLIPAKTIGDWEIRKNEDEKEIQLVTKGLCWMSNVTHEKETHEEFERLAKGQILIGGLGLGYASILVRDKKEVEQIDFMEKEKEVIELVADHIRHPKVNVFKFKASQYLSFCKKKYDLVFFDFFPDDPCFFPQEIKILKDLARNVLKPNGEVLFWRRYPMLDL